MGETMTPEIRADLKFTLRLELSKRISPAKKRVHQIDPDILAGFLVDQIELANFIVRKGPPMEAPTYDLDLPVRNSRPEPADIPPIPGRTVPE